MRVSRGSPGLSCGSGRLGQDPKSISREIATARRAQTRGVAKLAAPYRPRRPEDTVLHRVVRRHLETFIAHAAEAYDSPLPKYVRDELRAYVKCGIFAHGFLRARCDACNHDLLVAFSCKGRSVCPSCAGRRMNNTAAHMVDRVIPALPVRQWVLSLPFDLRARAAYDARTLTRVIRAFASALAARHRHFALSVGIGESVHAAITFVQRFGSSLNLNVHLHVIVVDGVFSRNDGALLFTPAPPPTRDELHRVITEVKRKLTQLDEPTHVQTTLGACMRLATARGDVRAMSIDGAISDEESEPRATESRAVDDAGFNLDASVHIDGDDDFGREHLLRYCARPALSLARLTELPNGMLAYRIKRLRNRRSKVRHMTPLELLARVAALVPPPRHPLVRFHGAFAPRSRWRRDVVPKPPPNEHQHEPNKPPVTERSHAQRAAHPASALTPRATRLAPNVLSVRHWDRLRSGALLAASPRVDWPTLMRRTFDADVLECPKCTGRLRVIAVVDDPATARAILDELAIRGPPPPLRARDPATLQPNLVH